MTRRDLSDTSNVEVLNLHKSFKNHKVLNNVSFSIKKGSIFALLGQNGAGKTTIIKILSTLLAPDGGQVNVCGFDVKTQGRHVRRSIGLTGQYASVDDLLSPISGNTYASRASVAF